MAGRLTGVILTVALLTGCAANSLDQTRDIYEPVSNMSRIAAQMHSQGDDEGAATFYQRALQQNPADIPAHKGLADIFEAHGDFASAAGQYHALEKLQPGEAEVHRAYGRILIKLNRPVDAKDQYEAALRLDSSDIRSLNGLGVALDYLGNHREAQVQYKKALDEKSGDMTTISNLAHSYVLSGRYNEAIKLLEPIWQSPQTPPALRQNLAEAYALAGMDVDAERVARVDLPPETVKKNMDYYHAERAKLLPPGAVIYADLGGFATPAMAQYHADEIKPRVGDEAAKLSFDIVPVVKTQGGTPQFFVQVHGFAKFAAAKAFCDKLRKQDVVCTAVQ